MANDMMDTLRGILGDNADEKIQSVLSGLQSNQGGRESSPEAVTAGLGGSNDYLTQIKSIVGQMENANDTRSNLLLSLKPYMRAERQKSIDSAVKILNLTRFSGLFK
jgi:hypothetical protein